MTNVRQAVPFFFVSKMDASLAYYVDGLGFVMKNRWMDAGELRWCWLELDEVALMLQEFRSDGNGSRTPPKKLGEGVSIYFICRDALEIYHQLKGRGIVARRPFVGNGMWVVEVTDPDGYRLAFESVTDVAEDTEYTEA